MKITHEPRPVREGARLNRLAWNIAVLAMLLAGVVLPSGCGRSGGQSVQAGGAGNGGPAAVEQPAPIHIPEGTMIPVRLLATISSRSARSGDVFDAELAEPLVIDGNTVFEMHARARGRVVLAQSSGRLKSPGYLSLTLESIQDPTGRWNTVSTASISASGGSHRDRNATLIGGGTAVGTIIGAIAGGGKGAAIGAVSGASAGTVGAMATGKKDVAFSVERVLRFKSIGDLTLNR